MVLRIFYKLILDIIDKGLKIFKVFLKKGFEVGPQNKNGAFITMLILSLLDADSARKK